MPKWRKFTSTFRIIENAFNDLIGLAILFLFSALLSLHIGIMFHWVFPFVF